MWLLRDEERESIMSCLGHGDHSTKLHNYYHVDGTCKHVFRCESVHIGMESVCGEGEVGSLSLHD